VRLFHNEHCLDLAAIVLDQNQAACIAIVAAFRHAGFDRVLTSYGDEHRPVGLLPVRDAAPVCCQRHSAPELFVQLVRDLY